MNERLKHQGRLAQLKENKAKQELKLEGLRDSIRDNLDPFEELIELNLELVAQQSIEATTLQIELKETIEKTAAVKKALGI